MTYSAITIRPPWAFWIADGLKTVETRTHGGFTSLVGHRIAIHCGKSFDYKAIRMASPFRAESSLIDSMMSWGQASYGRIVCTAFVRAHLMLGANDGKPALCDAGGLYGLILEDIDPVDEKQKRNGQLGIWKVELPR